MTRGAAGWAPRSATTDLSPDDARVAVRAVILARGDELRAERVDHLAGGALARAFHQRGRHLIARLETSPLWGTVGEGRGNARMSEKRANDATDGRVESRTSRARSARAHLVVELLEHDVDHFLLHVRGGAEGVLGKLGEKIGGGHVPKVCGEGTGGGDDPVRSERGEGNPAF